MLEAMPEVAQHVRSFGEFTVSRFRPRTGVGSDRDVVVVEQVGVLRQAMRAVPG